MAKEKPRKSSWGFIIGILVFLFILAYIFSSIISLMLGTGSVQQGNVAIIPIKGFISTEESADIFGSSFASSGLIVNYIQEAAANPSIQAIILEIDSPGGAPVATDEIATAVKRTNKTTVAWIREVGASGGYWIASASDYIIANRMSITGSIGVYGSYLEFSGLLADWNISYERLNAGKYKDTGAPFRKLTDEERDLLQKKIDMMHQIFKDAVQENRGLTNSEIEAAGNGEFYLGSEAKSLRLIDEIGGKQEAISFIEKKLGIEAELTVYEHKPTFFEALMGLTNKKDFSLSSIAAGNDNAKLATLS